MSIEDDYQYRRYIQHGQPREFSPGAVAQTALEHALRTDSSSERHRRKHERMWQPEPFNRRWSSGIRPLDDLLTTHDGGTGYYGFTALASEAKVGKSTKAIRSAFKAAASGNWRVVYFVGELDEPEWDEREARYLEAHPEDTAGLDMLRVYHVARGITPEKLTVLANEEPGPEPLLCVLDSINTLAKLSGRPYYPALEELCIWMMMARRISAGAASFLAISETNTRGGIKGEQLHYWADVVLRMQAPKDRKAADDGWVEFEVTHSRSTPSGYVGRFLRDRERETFRVPGAQSNKSEQLELHVLAGGKLDY